MSRQFCKHLAVSALEHTAVIDQSELLETISKYCLHAGFVWTRVEVESLDYFSFDPYKHNQSLVSLVADYHFRACRTLVEICDSQLLSVWYQFSVTFYLIGLNKFVIQAD